MTDTKISDAERADSGWKQDIIKINPLLYVRIDTGPDHESAILCWDDGEADTRELARFPSLTLARTYIEIEALASRHQEPTSVQKMHESQPSTSEGEAGKHLWVMEEIAANLLTGDRTAATKLREAIDFFSAPQPAPVVTDEIEAAYRRGHLDGRCGGTIATEDDDWQKYAASLQKQESGE